MIITRLQGGLGNQLFQYAAGRRLALRHSTTLKFDLSAFAEDHRRSYALDHFAIDARIASTDEIRLVLTRQCPAFLHVLPGISSFRSAYLTENTTRFSPTIQYMPKNSYLNGYWQSEKYFFDIRDTLRQELTVTSAPTGENAVMLAAIAAVNAVSVHIRRGDYVTNEKTFRILGPCPVSYYAHAAEILAAEHHDLHFFVFSDDPAWAAEHIRLPAKTTIVSHNGPAQDYEDLRLMSACKHHIIANSSFSWWGAWLGSFPDKKVYAPRQWFKDRRYHTNDLLPKEWIPVE